MKTDAVTPDDLVRSVMALPPMARDAEGAIARAPNEAIVAWLRSAGVSTFLYGGCANFFNIGVGEYGAALDFIESLAGPREWIIPSIGPDFGKALDQAAILRGRAFPSAMLLPFAPVTQSGVATGLRRLSDKIGRPLMIFFKSPDYVGARDLARLLADGVLCCLEYGIAGSGEKPEPFLADLLDAAGTAQSIIDGAGERTVVGLARFGITGFTTGSGVVGPHLSMALLAALKRGDLVEAARLREYFLELEALRQAHSPIPVLHDAVALAGIAETGPIGPLFSNIEDEAARRQIRRAATTLRAASLAAA
jgi:dihydrodipicolinate synthase/N-acetylneuraminate lyase